MSAENNSIVSVIPLTGLKKELEYRVPEPVRGRLQVGSLVRIPILNRTNMGVVCSLRGTSEYPLSKLKYLFTPVYDFPVLPGELLPLARWISTYYAASLDVVLEAMLPASVRRGMNLKQRRMIGLKLRFEKEELEKLRRRAPKQAQLYDFLCGQFKPVPALPVLKRMGVGISSCEALVKKGIVEESIETVERLAYDDELGDEESVALDAIVLNDDQVKAVAAFKNSIAAKQFSAHLLHGVTGSGKTEVYIHAMQKALKEGGGVIFLVPEVALSPQMVGRLRSRLQDASGEKVMVWHSQLSDGERLDAWHALATGVARIVVGARSAIFAPVRDLRLIIVDEEHEPAYKQDETPRYHGRDVAVYRAHQMKAVCVMGSATPSLESLYNVDVGKYHLSRLPVRVDDRKLPLIHVVDMKSEIMSSRKSVILSRLLVEKMLDRFEKKEQTILFINRRGFSTSLLCPKCGYVATCDHCSVALTYHRHDEKIRCHFCDLEESAPTRCPKCRSNEIRWRGKGTQKVEDVARKILPGAEIVRIDTDAMSKKNRFRAILGEFRRGRIDVLVGTQMIAKGLDFPNVTLVGLVDADLSQHLPDFRAAERTFQLIVQVAGRAGRGDRAGEVIIQSFLPSSAPIQFARRAEFEEFQTEELAQRREYHYPPYRHLIHHMFRSKNEDKVAFYAEQWVRLLEKELKDQIEIRGPAPAPIEKLKDHYRYQAWYFVSSVTPIIPKITALRSTFKMDRDVIDVFDVDPMNLM